MLSRHRRAMYPDEVYPETEVVVIDSATADPAVVEAAIEAEVLSVEAQIAEIDAQIAALEAAKMALLGVVDDLVEVAAPDEAA